MSSQKLNSRGDVGEHTEPIDHGDRLGDALHRPFAPTHRHVVEQLDDHIEDCFACYAFPPAHRVRLRTTNGLERLKQEIKRRTRVVRIFPNREACLRLASALFAEQSEDWVTGHRYPDISELRQWQRDHAPKEVALTAV